jgi:CO/xanthine dehydrogenase FAD-binding subunit
MNPVPYHRPASLTEAIRLHGDHPGAQFVAGGTDVIVKMKSGTLAPSALISIRNLAELRGVEVGPDGARIGAATPLEMVRTHAELQAGWPILVDAVGRMAGVQIRNAGTLGGNLCNASPCADAAPPLIALDAVFRLEGPDGVRRIEADAFFTGPGQTAGQPGEVLTHIELPPAMPSARGAFLRKQRVAMDLAQVNVAVWLEPGTADADPSDAPSIQRVRIVAGAVAPTPLRLQEAEAIVLTGPPTPETFAAAGARAAELVSPITDIRATAAYRRHITGVLVRRGLEQCWSAR